MPTKRPAAFFSVATSQTMVYAQVIFDAQTSTLLDQQKEAVLTASNPVADIEYLQLNHAVPVFPPT